MCPRAHLLASVPAPVRLHLLVGQGVHVANNLGCHLARVRGPVLEGSLDDGHDEGQGRGINEVDKLGVQQGLQALLGLPGRVRQGIQQDGGNGCIPKQGGVGERGVRAAVPWSPSPQLGKPVCLQRAILAPTGGTDMEAVAATSLPAELCSGGVPVGRLRCALSCSASRESCSGTIIPILEAATQSGFVEN